MKKILSLLFAVFLLLPGIPVSAERKSYSDSLSPGMDVIRQNFVLRKAAESGSKINFTPNDFAEFCGEKDFEHITIATLPKNTSGILMLEGREVLQGESIPKNKIEKMTFQPLENTAFSSDFTFSFPGEKESWNCLLYFTENARNKLFAADVSLSTYRNVAVMEVIEMPEENDGAVLEVLSTCKHGVLELYDAAAGIICYRPQRNFIGTDHFTYRLCDAFGNQSEIRRATIEVSRAQQNLYFCDMADSAYHKAAIVACKKGQMEYDVVDGLPVFHPDEKIDLDSFYRILEVGLNGKIHFSENTLETESQPEKDVVPFSTALRYVLNSEIENQDKAVQATPLSERMQSFLLDDAVLRELAENDFPLTKETLAVMFFKIDQALESSAGQE